MRFRLRPVDGSFYDLFSQMASQLVDGADLLSEMLSTSGDRMEVAQRMRAAEHAADETTHQVIRRVNQTFVTPFDREDIYSLASAMDDVMDEMERAVDLIVLYEVETLPGSFPELAQTLQTCAEVTRAAMPRMQSLKGLEDYWIEVNRLENAGDDSFRKGLADLFAGKYSPLEVLKLKDILEALEAGVDAFEKVANIVEQIAVKES